MRTSYICYSKESSLEVRSYSPPGIAAHDRHERILGHVAVDARADRDADDHIQPDLADDLAGRLPGLINPLRPGWALQRGRALAGLDLPDKVLDWHQDAQESA